MRGGARDARLSGLKPSRRVDTETSGMTVLDAHSSAVKPNSLPISSLARYMYNWIHIHLVENKYGEAVESGGCGSDQVEASNLKSGTKC